jgi:predicted nucleic acid-binding protein
MATTESPACIVVCDAGPLIHLDEIDALDLLADFPRVLVPDAVWREVQRHRPTALANPSLVIERLEPVSPAPPELQTLSQVLSLHSGEWQALRLVLEHPPALLLTNDTAARLAATNFGITAHGTIGILIRAIRRKLRSKQQVLSLLRSIPSASTLHLKRSLLAAVIREVENNPKSSQSKIRVTETPLFSRLAS